MNTEKSSVLLVKAHVRVEDTELGFVLSTHSASPEPGTVTMCLGERALGNPAGNCDSCDFYCSGLSSVLSVSNPGYVPSVLQSTTRVAFPKLLGLPSTAGLELQFSDVSEACRKLVLAHFLSQGHVCFPEVLLHHARQPLCVQVVLPFVPSIWYSLSAFPSSLI